jgi:3-hydroxyisobutyrate dehydrogenase-like beta-hydroxyacid dehydrogenase
MLLGGPDAAMVAERLCSIGMNVKAISDRIGVASAIKMCRSIIVKGLEAITVESMFTAQRQDWLAQAIAEFPLAVPKNENFAWQELADAIAEATSPQEKSWARQ